MTLDKAKRILPSFVSHLGNGDIDIHILRARVNGHLIELIDTMTDKLAETHSGMHMTAEIKAIDRQCEQLTRFLDATK